MARPTKYGFDYFSLDCDLNDDLKFIVSKFGLIGIGTVIRLWSKCYKTEGYFCEWTEKNRYIFCLEHKIEISQLQEILNACFEVELFDPKLYNEYQILTSIGIQERYIKICTEAKRKNFKIDPLYYLEPKKESFSGINQGFSGINSTGDGVSSGLSTQSKVKESKGKESKELKDLSSAPYGAPDAGKVKKPVKKKRDPVKETPDRPFWQKLVDTFHIVYKDLKKEDPSFIGRKIADFRNLYDLLRNRARIKKVDWSEDYAVKAMTNFLKEADSDKWLSDRFTIKNLVEQFDAIIARAAEKSKSEKGNKTTLQGFDQDLKYLVERYREPDFILETIDPDFYDKMTSRNLLPIGSLNKFDGDIETKKRKAVEQFLTLNSKTNV